MTVQAGVERIEETRDRLLNRGRAAVGVTGEASTEPLRTVLRRHGTGPYTVVALGLLAFVDGFQGLVIGVLGPEVSRGLGISKASLASFLLLKSLSLSVATMVVAHLVGKRAIRGVVAIATAFAWSIATLFTGLVVVPWQLAALLVVDGLTSASVAVLHNPLLMDTYPPQARIRIVSSYMLFLQGTGIAAPLLVAILVGPLDLTWRGTLLVLGVLSVLVSFVGVRLRDPGFGRFDTGRIRAAVREEEHAGPVEPVEPDPALGFFEVVKRLLLVPTVRRIIAASIVAGMAGVPFATYFTFFLADRWGMSPSARAVFGSITPVLTFVVVPFVARYGEGLFRRDPADVLRFAVKLQLTSVAVTVVAILSPFFVLMAVCISISIAIPFAIGPAVSTTVMAIIPARMRAHFIALLSIATLGAGGIAGVLLLSGLERRVGQTLTLVAISIPLSIGILLFRGAARSINADLDRTVEDVIEREELDVLASRGVRLPMIACRRIDFSYGRLQVLFDVDFTVDDGEMVALLGTNGAGKSTLLSVISGINLPASGTVRFHGGDITYVDAERRVRMGISQIPGGRAVFEPLTVAENLRLYGHIHGRSPRRVDAAFEAFPRLAERRNQLASTLSGGEQQMLGLAQALVLQPRLLCIDELSLGLAPKIVGELLDMVRTINASGTAVVLVEQSATIALSLVEHAYFMERGEIRFDGRASDLLGRSDLLRSVFLRGTSAVRS